ncbi:restriction endonuclease subunit S [Aliivibrio fischeri]|uniref:restriction endonuclease subunit S n=1 Tax=Aliivibrio fischeri TaxID=668 RepID=UPI00084BDE73|nr:restriction endonuclease subunit S [Aliivibrio fischeri]OED51245.1 hypothetical protein BEI47_20150 [Aliivibrio fischeri]
MNLEIKRLGDVCDFYNGKAHEKSISDLGKIKVVNSKFVSSEGVKYKLTEQVIFPLYRGDICLVMSDVPNGKTLAKCFLVDADDTYSLNQRICAIRTQQFDVKFLFYQLNRHPFLLEFNNGENQTNLRKADILNCPLWVPQIPEQKRIVALLDTVFADLEQIRAKTEQNLKNACELFDSYLQQVFTQKDDDWEQEKWGDLCQFIRGPFGGSLKKSMFKSEGYAVYEQKHAIHDHIEQLRYYVDEEKFEEMKRFELKPGELIMSCSGTLGKASVIPEGAPKGIINQALLKITANENVDIHFLKYWIRSKIFQDIIYAHSGGAAIANVPAAKILKEIKLQIPTIEKQKIIVSEIDLMVSKRDSLLLIYTEKLAALDELKKSILQKAFSGELTHD